MTTQNNTNALSVETQVAQRITAALSRSNENLPHNTSERLRAARVRAVMARKKPLTLVRTSIRSGSVLNGQGSLSLGGGGGDRPMRQWLLGLAPIVILSVAMMMVSDNLQTSRSMEIAEVDAAILIDDLPPEAYADPGFLQFVKNNHSIRN
jgi:Protein of unknown function (DUF3619)